ncbi:MAG: GNAT family N-acetyltransferase [Gammaproteobacteria bacterium]|nr:GNAT family N-acetyltransferase [Gammaproteobacteria bacterium]
MPAPDWIFSSFEELDSKLLYAMLGLRAEVFVVEQEYAYQDLDGHDQDALHLCGLYDGELACYARINAPGTKTPYTAISRVLVRKEYRGEGLGRLLMRETLARCERLWPGATTGLSAQQYLVEFYASLGFRAVSNPYDEEGIPHVDMLR